MIKRFKDGSNNWWVNGKHYAITNGKPILVSGGVYLQEDENELIEYLKNKK